MWHQYASALMWHQYASALMRMRELACLCVLLGCACKQVDVVAVRDSVLTPKPDASDADAREPDTQIPCAYEVQAPAGAAAQVTAASARKLSYAICSCAGVTSSDALKTDAFDSARGPYASGELGGDVGVDDEMSVESSSMLAGRLIVAGSGGLRLGNQVELDVGDDLAVGGPLEGALSSVRVTGDATIAGRIDLAGLTVSHVLLQPAGSERHVSGTSTIATIRSGDVSVPAPCDCDSAALFDTYAFVAAQAPLAAPLPAGFVVGNDRCAAYKLADGEASSVHITLHAPTVIYAAGDLHVAGDLVVDSDAGAALDLFIADDVRIDGRIVLGTGAGQGPVHVYVGGSGTVQLSSGGELHGVLYAPKAELVLSAPLTVYGALLVHRVAASAALTVHYDRSLARDANN